MPDRPSLIYDFLDPGPGNYKPGTYYFDEEDKDYLSDIPSELFSYRVKRYPIGDLPGTVVIYPNYVELSDVFSTTRATIPTYVSREYRTNQTYEATLELAKKDSGGIVLIYGPSKLGKTVLWKSVFDPSEYVVVSCSRELPPEDLYERIVSLLGLPSIIEAIEDKSDTESTNSTKGIKLGKGIAEVTLGKSKSKSSTQGQQRRLGYPSTKYNVDSLLHILKDENKIVVFENFHRLCADTLRRVSVDLRTLSDNLINTLFVGIPEDPYAITRYNSELEGRISYLPFSVWTINELKKIAVGGQQILRVQFSDKSLDFLSEEAAGSPLLMQLYCFIACISSGVVHTQDEEKEINIAQKEFRSVMKEWGIQRFEVCCPAYENILRISNIINGLPNNFIENALAEMKTPKPSLFLNLKKMNFWPDYKTAIREFIARLNENESTIDIFSINDEKGILNICRPLFLSYVRWIV